jgi:hypothetical protein
MRQIAILFLIISALFATSSCNGQKEKKNNVQNKVSSKVEVYYFHFTRRCNTCVAVEENAKKAVEMLYSGLLKTGEYSFKGINLDDASSKAIAEKLGIGGQTLLVVCGNNKIDITDKGFMNAHDLEKMKEEIQKAVNKATKG